MTANADRDPLDDYFGFERATQRRFVAGQRLDGYARAVLLQMASHRMWKRQSTVWAYVGVLASETGICERTVSDRLARLEDAGWLVRTGATKRRAVEYSLAIPAEPKSAPHADFEAAKSAPHAENPLHHVQTSSELNLLEADPELAPAGDGPAEPGSEARRRLISMRLAADAGRPPSDPVLAAALTVDAALSEPAPDLDALTGVENSARFLAALDGGLWHVQRLPEPMTVRQLELTVLGILALPDAEHLTGWDLTVETGAGGEWRDVRTVTSPVEFVVGCVAENLRRERERREAGRAS